jgi:hypothetical protein
MAVVRLPVVLKNLLLLRGKRIYFGFTQHSKSIIKKIKFFLTLLSSTLYIYVFEIFSNSLIRNKRKEIYQHHISTERTMMFGNTLFHQLTL